MRGLHKRALDYEEQLNALPPKNSEDKAAKLRKLLCEVLADMVLSDPAFAVRKDAYQRLWTNCFYGRIGTLRSRVSREKRKKGPNLAVWEQTLKAFLADGIKLYDYLVQKFEAKLLPPSAESQSDSQDGTEPSMDGVVLGLYRLCIHLGDLYRYSGNFKEAEANYQKAAKLAPGKGNPYNQLAVISQMKNDPNSPQSCVAYYFYIRALLASDQPFPTAEANHKKLMESNRAYLRSMPTAEGNTALQHGIPTKKAAQELERRKRSAATKRFLASFVDLHYDLLVFPSKQQDMTELELIQKINSTLDEFGKLLAQTALGDPLLIKMVAINAFSVSIPPSTNQGSPPRDPTLARALFLRFGAEVANRVVIQGKKGNSTNYRYLTPLLLCAEMAGGFQWAGIQMTDLGGQEAEKAELLFWSKASEAANHWNVNDESEIDFLGSLPKDYEALKGFKPFSFIATSVDEKGVVAADQAVAELALDGENHAISQELDNRIRLSRFASLMSMQGGKKVLLDEATGLYSVFSQRVDEETDVHDEVMVNAFEDGGGGGDVNAPMIDVPASSATDELVSSSQPDGLTIAPEKAEKTADNPSVLEYRPSGNGAGPALLVPGALLMGGAAPHIENEKPNEAAAAAGPNLSLVTGNPLPQVAPTLSPPPGLPPPPGFATANGTEGGLLGGFSLASSQHPGIPIDAFPQGFAARNTAPSTMLGYLQSQPEPATSNPFASAYPMPAAHSADTLLQQQENVDAMALLDSSLLKSLWGSPTKDNPVTRNPFFES